MRPVQRGPSPGVFTSYKQAKEPLVRVLGTYCSYCERRVVTELAVEHIQPKGLPKYAHLECEWANFLLACKNCNSAKGDTDVNPADFFLPDRDNTIRAFEYPDDGSVIPANDLDAGQTTLAQATINLVALNTVTHPNWTDADSLQSALDRWSQRQAAITQAKAAKANLAVADNPAHRSSIEMLAENAGFFSVWMDRFNSDADMRLRFIRRLLGTDTDSFDSATGVAVARPGGQL